jgi:hypothetical protein
MMNSNEKAEGAIEGRILPDLSQAAPAPIGKAARKAAKGKAKAAPKAEGKAAPKKGLAARNDRFAAEKAKAEKARADRPLSAGSDISRDAVMKFSGLAHNMPSAADIEKAEGLCKRMIGRDLARYKEALKGNLPVGEFSGEGFANCPIDLSLRTHEGYRGKWKALSALIAAGDLAALEGWNGGLGIRQNSSSSKPLGRFHQCAILAMRAKAAAKAKRQAGKAAKADQPQAAPEADQPQG